MQIGIATDTLFDRGGLESRLELGDTDIKMIAGAIIVLAGSVALGAGVVGLSVLRHANRSPEGEAAFGIYAGVALVIIGLVVLCVGSLYDGKSRTP